MKITSDIHIHTNLSSCAREEATLERYVEKAKGSNLQVLGFANHLWDSAIDGASNWYAPQTVEHVLKLKVSEIKEDESEGTAIRIGAFLVCD